MPALRFTSWDASLKNSDGDLIEVQWLRIYVPLPVDRAPFDGLSEIQSLNSLRIRRYPKFRSRKVAAGRWMRALQKEEHVARSWKSPKFSSASSD